MGLILVAAAMFLIGHFTQSALADPPCPPNGVPFHTATPTATPNGIHR